MEQPTMRTIIDIIAKMKNYVLPELRNLFAR